MGKVIIHGIVFIITTLLFVFLYFAFFTYSKYSGKPQFIPSPIFPMFMLALFTVIFYYSKHLLKLKLTSTIALSIVVVFLFVFIFFTVDAKYSYIFEHYYQRFPYSNLLNLPEYSNQQGNFITVSQRLEQDGIKVTSLNEGNTDNFNPEIIGVSFSKMIYFVNHEKYIIFDWDKKEIIYSTDKRELEASLIDFMEKNGKVINYEGSFVTVRYSDGETRNYRIIPTDDGIAFQGI